MPTYKSEFVQLADELFEEFADFITVAEFKNVISFDRFTGDEEDQIQNVEGIQVKVNEKLFDPSNVKVGDYMQVYLRRNLQWLPEVGKTVVKMRGVEQHIIDIKYDAADAAAFLHVRRK